MITAGYVPDADAVHIAQRARVAEVTFVDSAEGNTTSYAYSARDLLTGEPSPASGATIHQYEDHGALGRTTGARTRQCLQDSLHPELHPVRLVPCPPTHPPAPSKGPRNPSSPGTSAFLEFRIRSE